MKIRPLVLVLFAAGCSQTQVLKPQEFYSPTTQSSAEEPVAKIDSSSAPLYDQVKTDKPRTLGNLHIADRRLVDGHPHAGGNDRRGDTQRHENGKDQGG